MFLVRSTPICKSCENFTNNSNELWVDVYFLYGKWYNVLEEKGTFTKSHACLTALI